MLIIFCESLISVRMFVDCCHGDIEQIDVMENEYFSEESGK